MLPNSEHFIRLSSITVNCKLSPNPTLLATLPLRILFLLRQHQVTRFQDQSTTRLGPRDPPAQQAMPCRHQLPVFTFPAPRHPSRTPAASPPAHPVTRDQVESLACRLGRQMPNLRHHARARLAHRLLSLRPRARGDPRIPRLMVRRNRKRGG